MVQVTSREFRSNQASIFAKADLGEQVIIKRRGKQSYMLMPVSDDDFIMSEELKNRISEARKQHAQGELRKFNDPTELSNWLENI